MFLIKNLLILSNVAFNFLIIIWGMLCFNSYREEIMYNLVVPQNLLVNKSFFFTLLSTYLSSNTEFTFIFDNLTNINLFFFHLFNALFILILSILNFETFKNCDRDCLEYLENNNYNNFGTFYEYLPVFQIVVVVSYFGLLVYNKCQNKQIILFNENEINNMFSEELNQGTLQLISETPDSISEY